MNSATPVVICTLSESSAADLAEIDKFCNTPPWSAALFRSEFQNRVATVFGARTKGELVGFLVIHTIVDESHIMTFGVRPDYRGQRVGKELLLSALRTLHEKGVKRVTLEVRVSNEPAQALYHKFGFNEVGVREGYYVDNREDALTLALDLTDFISQWGGES